MTEYTNEQLSELLAKRLDSNPHFTQISQIAFSNTKGNVWLIGGAVSRTLASELYGTPCAIHDFDIVTDGELTEPLVVPNGWSVAHTKFGNPTFSNGVVSVDVWPISSQSFVREQKLKPTIENLFLGVAYTIQAMGYNLKTKELVGETGISALKKRVFTVNNVQTAQSEAVKKGMTLFERMERKAKSMQFTAVLKK